jgi:HlyD family secretion protein
MREDKEGESIMHINKNSTATKNIKIKTIGYFSCLIIISSLLLAGCNSTNTLVLSGSIEAPQVEVNSEVAGKVIKLDKDEGSLVKAGDVIATLDDSSQKLIVKQQEDLVKIKQAMLDEIPSDSSKEKIKAAKADLDQSKAALDLAKLILSKFQVKATINGTYTQRNINLGDIISIGTSIATLSDLSDLFVNVYIPQRNLQNVSLNQEVNLKTVSGKNIKGKLLYIANEAEYTPKNIETTEAKENTVYKLKVKITDNIDILRPGMTVEAYIPIGGK